jgi:hypothetical protein
MPETTINANNPSLNNNSKYFNLSTVTFNFTAADDNLFGWAIRCVNAAGAQEYYNESLGLSGTSVDVVRTTMFPNIGMKYCNITVEDDHTDNTYSTEINIKKPLFGKLGVNKIDFGKDENKVEFIWDERNKQKLKSLDVEVSEDRVSPIINLEKVKESNVDIYWTIKFEGEIYDRSEISGIPGHIVLWSGSGESQWYDAVDEYKNSKIDYVIEGNEIKYHASIPASEWTGEYKTKSLGGLNSQVYSFSLESVSSINVSISAVKIGTNDPLPFNATLNSFSYGYTYATSSGSAINVTIPAEETSFVVVNSTSAMNTVSTTITDGSPSSIIAELYQAIVTVNVYDALFGSLVQDSTIDSINLVGDYNETRNESSGTEVYYLGLDTYYFNASADETFTPSETYEVLIDTIGQTETVDLYLNKTYHLTLYREETGDLFNFEYQSYDEEGNVQTYDAEVITQIVCPDKNIVLTYSNMSSGQNWLSSTNLTAIDIVNPENIFVGGPRGMFGRYDYLLNTSYQLNTTDAYDWLSTNAINVMTSLDVDTTYIGADNGRFGKYSKTSNVMTDLSSKDPGNWISTSDILSMSAVDENAVYLGMTDGKLGRYNSTSNLITDLSATDIGNWLGSQSVLAVFALDNQNVFVGSTLGRFGVYNLSNASLSNLSNVDPSDWMSTNINAIYAIDSSKVYVGGDSGRFGKYSLGGLLLNLSNTDTGNWLGSNNVTVIYALDDNTVFIGATNGKFGVYSTATNVTSDLSSTDVGNWFGTNTIRAMSMFDDTNLFLSGDNGLFGVYNILQNTTIRITGSDAESTSSFNTLDVSNIDCPFTTWRTIVTYPQIVDSTGNYFSYERQIVPSLYESNVSIYLIEAGESGLRVDDPVNVKINLRDISGDYNSGYFEMLTNVGGTITSVLLQPYDVSNQINLWLDKNQIYTPCIYDNNLERTCLKNLYAITDTETSLTVPDIPLYDPDPNANALVSVDVIPSRTAGTIRLAMNDKSGGKITYYTLKVYNYTNGAVQTDVIFEKSYTGEGFTSMDEVLGPLNPLQSYYATYEYYSDSMEEPIRRSTVIWFGKTTPETDDMGGFEGGKGLLLIIGLGLPLLTILIMSMISVDIGVLIAMVELTIFNKLGFLDIPMFQNEFMLLPAITWYISLFSIMAVLSIWRKMRRAN